MLNIKEWIEKFCPNCTLHKILKNILVFSSNSQKTLIREEWMKKYYLNLIAIIHKIFEWTRNWKTWSQLKLESFSQWLSDRFSETTLKDREHFQFYDLLKDEKTYELLNIWILYEI